jgi:hypothetical protein
MAITNNFGLSSQQVLKSNKGYWAASGQVDASTNNKPVILIENIGQRDSVATVTFSGSIAAADLAAGNTSKVECIIDGDILYQVKVNSLDGFNPYFTEFTIFVPARTSFRIDITDSDTTGKHTTILRGYYL